MTMVVCKDCGRTMKHHAKALCKSCYYRLRTCICAKCGKTATLGARGRCLKCYRGRLRKCRSCGIKKNCHGRNICAPCFYRKEGGKIDRAAREYSLPHGRYEAIVALPCGLCGTTAGPRVCDHDHTTGKVRGPLCARCNIGMHYIDRRDDWIQKALDWAKRGT